MKDFIEEENAAPAQAVRPALAKNGVRDLVHFLKLSERQVRHRLDVANDEGNLTEARVNSLRMLEELIKEQVPK